MRLFIENKGYGELRYTILVDTLQVIGQISLTEV